MDATDPDAHDAAAPAAPPHRPLIGLGWMVATGLCFVGVQTFVKLVGDAIPAAQSAFLRYVLGFVLLLPMLRGLGAARLDRSDWLWFAGRALAHALAIIFWFYAMTRIPMAEVTAMNYLYPVYVALGAAVLLGEQLAWRRILAIAVALLGALVILRPGLRSLDTGHLAMLAAALAFGASYLATKFLSRRHSADVIVALLSLMVPIWLAPLAFADWVTPTLRDIAYLFVVAVFATAGHYAMTLAFRAAPVSVTQPAVFLQLVWSVMVGLAVFGEPVDPWVVLGGTMIIGAVSFIAWREARLRRG